MGKQHNKVIKRKRRKLYLKRKDELEKQSALLRKKSKPAAAKVEKPEPTQKSETTPAKKTAKKAAKKVAKKAVAKKAPAKKAAKKAAKKETE